MLKGKLIHFLVSLGMVLVLLFPFEIPVFAASDTVSTKYDYVALGDSLAAGQDPYGTTSGYGYTNFIADYLEEAGVLNSFINYGVSGYTSSDLIKQLSDADVQSAIRNADIITLDIGANDIIGLVMEVLRSNETDTLPTIQNTYDNIETILETIRELNQSAKLYMMGYYNALPRLTEGQSVIFLSCLSVFNTSLQEITEKCGVTYVDTFSAMNSQLLEFLPGDIHPTIPGYQVIADQFWEKIKVDFNLSELNSIKPEPEAQLQFLWELILILSQK